MKKNVIVSLADSNYFEFLNEYVGIVLINNIETIIKNIGTIRS